MTRTHVSFTAAALGAEIQVPALEPLDVSGAGADAKKSAEKCDKSDQKAESKDDKSKEEKKPPTPAPTHTVKLAPGTQPGAVITLKGRGVPRLDGRGRGSLVVVVQVDVPKTLSDRAKTLLTELAEELDEASGGSKKRVAAGK